MSKICYCRSYRSLSVTGFDRNGLVPYSNASSIKAIIWSDFVIIAIATFVPRNFAECSQTTSETEQLHILVTMHFTRFSESKKAFRSDTLQKRAIRWPWFYYHFFLKDKFPSVFCRRLVHCDIVLYGLVDVEKIQIRFFVTVLSEIVRLN